MKVAALLLAIIWLIVQVPTAGSAASPAPTLPAGRTFYMGVTPTVHDETPDGVNQVYAFIRRDTDLNVHHFDDGVPWPEAFAGRPYHPNVEKDLKERTERLVKGRPTYVAVTAIREHGLTGYWAKDRRMALPEPWKHKAVDDPEVVRAYLSFCRDLIRRFHPDYFAYGIEVNMNDRALWTRSVSLAKQIYGPLKAEYPRLRVFVTIQADVFWQDARQQTEDLRQVLPYTDYIAVSAYPYFFDHADPATLPRTFFSRIHALAPEKPFAVAETAFTATNVEAFGKKIPGRTDWQSAYLMWLLQESNNRQARFVVWFFYRDYDALWNKMKLFRPFFPVLEVFKVFKNDGLLDGAGRDRPAAVTWRAWLGLPRQ